jgi:NTP pyrophosphatase (non-canonical NTP hydrolase)
MTFDEYQKQALTTAYTDPKHKDTLMDKTIWVMGIAGEAGEVVEKWKKIVAYKGGEITSDDLQLLKKELGDVVWYIAVLAESLGLSLEEIMQLNVDKLKDRKKRDVIKGEGDSR